MTKHIYQRNNNDCALACIAMAAGKEYDELWTEADVEDIVKCQGADRKKTNSLLEKAGFILMLMESLERFLGDGVSLRLCQDKSYSIFCKDAVLL